MYQEEFFVKSKMAILDSAAGAVAFASTAKPVVVFGDLMLDAYLDGEISRISPEAPVPVLSKPSEERYAIGGAGNVAHNLRTLGNTVRLVSGIGAQGGVADEAGKILLDLLEKAGLPVTFIATLERKTTKKKRIISGNQQILRIDSEDTFTVSEEEEKTLSSFLESAIEGAGAVVVSDYAKGILSKGIVSRIESLAEKEAIPVLVDTKLKNLDIFSSPSLIKPNLKEAQEFTGMSYQGSIHDVENMAAALRERFSCKVVITCGGLGMVLHDGSDIVHVSAREKPVFDVSGAGDTVIASLAHCILRGLPLDEAASFASVAAGIAISRKGTSTVEISEIKSELDKVIVPKVWGHEEWIVNSEYCGKKLVLEEGYCCSLHYHKIKDETFYIASGRVGFQLNDEHFILNPGDSLLITPGTKHRFYGLQRSEIFEFSTHHMEDDSYRDEESGSFEKSFFEGIPDYHSK
jgi:rfaE bifunctional protein kinase chain/domain